MKITLRELDGTSRGYYLLLGVLALVTAIGMGQSGPWSTTGISLQA